MVAIKVILGKEPKFFIFYKSLEKMCATKAQNKSEFIFLKNDELKKKKKKKN